MKKSYILHMTWEEFREAATLPNAVAVIPLGTTEQEGTHLPLGVDTIVAEGIAKGLEGEEGILIGPLLPIGYSKWFSPFPGTISLEHETMVGVLRDYCISLIDHGLRRLVFLNAHRGNNACIEVTSRNLTASHSVRMGMLSVWKLANDLTAGMEGLREGRFTHAGEIMTSLVMALRPETVVTRRMQSGSIRSPQGSSFRVNNSLGEVTFRNSVQTVYQDIREITDTGTLGDPSHASVEKGKKILGMILDYTRDFLQEFRTLPFHEV